MTPDGGLIALIVASNSAFLNRKLRRTHLPNLCAMRLLPARILRGSTSVHVA